MPQSSNQLDTQDLRALWRPGKMLVDGNGDGVVDAISAGFILPAGASSVHLAVAANIAARLGFETTGLDLPLPRSGDTAMTFVIGRDALDSLPWRTDPAEELQENAAAIVTLSRSADRRVLSIVEKSRAGLWAAGRYVAEMSTASDSALTVMVDAVIAALPDKTTAILNSVAVDRGGEVVAFQLELGSSLPSSLHSTDLAVGEPAVRVVLASHDGARAVLRTHRPSLESREVNGGSPYSPPSSGDLSRFYRAGGAFEGNAAHPMTGRSDYLICIQEEAPQEVVDLAARIGLEAADLRLPLVSCAGVEGRSDRPRIVIGPPQGAPADDVGRIFIADRKDSDAPCIRVSGDRAGLSAALTYLSQTCPYLREYGKGLPDLCDAANRMAAHLSSASPAGQAAAAIVALDEALGSKSDVLSQAHIVLDRADPRLERFLNARWPHTEIRVHSRDVHTPTDHTDGHGIACDVKIPSEIEELWSIVETTLIQNLRERPSGEIAIFAGISEAPEVRRQLEAEIERRLFEATGDIRAEVTILSAYKQGYSWLAEEVLPRLIDARADEVIIRVRRHGPPPNWPIGTMLTPTRWLHEIYPVDALICETLRLAPAAVRFEIVDQSADTYEIVALRSGEISLRESFTPRCVTRPLIDHLPDYERVQVTTGWIDVRIDSELIHSGRIVTDSERFWDHYQSVTLPGLADYLMQLCGGRPDPGDAPFFGELRVEVALSEPDYRLGIGEEVISAIDALHEEIYLATRRFFEILGQFRVGAPLTHVGRIIPVVRAVPPGAEQYCRIRFSPFAAPFPTIRFGGKDVAPDQRLLRRTLATPRVIECAADKSGLQSLTLSIDCDDRLDSLQSLRNATYAPGPSAGLSGISQRQLVVQAEALHLLAQDGLYADDLSLDGVHRVEFRATGDKPALTGIDLFRRRQKAFSIEEWAMPTPFDPEVDCVCPVVPSRADSILAWMNGFPQAHVYRVGESYLGKPIWALDLAAPIVGQYFSRLKRSITKPTVMITARQHANEVSSTSHALQLPYLILTREEHGALLNDLNFVVHPIHNRDGAELVAELSALSPNLMLHAGYFGALGIDVGHGHPGDHPIMPESRVRPRLWDLALPDVVLNPHGQPAHEWVMPFSEYVGWGISRTNVVRQFWAPRPWFIPDANFLRGENYAGHRQAVYEILRRIRNAQDGDAQLRDASQAAADRYRRYTVDVDPTRFQFPGGLGTPIYFWDPLGTDVGAASHIHHWMNHYPDVTIWQGVIEAPDEPCSGEALSLLCRRGLKWMLAVAGYLRDYPGVIEHIVEKDRGTSRFAIKRVRPAREVRDRASVMSPLDAGTLIPLFDDLPP